ncbi:pyridoxamine 5'-phosphate oxidase family protein [Phytoactinopolyspora endophytica]|uniref:pyridoxamine 5'-phosphate oxidase family protein n=1 Tax=Phytoactinopolyspora endophytica TaxID=1642495 RepID=UPI00101C69F0|nr:pyridoxamine 5'-phosphate oxidase family protein [Phytoactinopolyspora endophytica]
MGTVFPEIDDALATWLVERPMFFVSTAPLAADGRVNVSPKGGTGCLKVMSPHQVAYVDFFGSGIETVAHLKENGRIAMMFCAFDGPPRIIRLHGTGETIDMADPRFEPLFERFDPTPEMVTCTRSIILVDVARVSDSCGFAVPEMTFRRERQQLYKYAEGRIRKEGPTAIRDYCDVNNAESIDGLPGLPPFADAVDDDTRTRYLHHGRKL